MARILIAWELGEAFGHLARCMQLADGLRQHGHVVLLALKDVRLPVSTKVAPGVTIVPAPLTPQKRIGRRPPINYADVLHHCGFACAGDIAARLMAWQGLFSLGRPDIVIADHAPTALLGARIAGIQCLAVGNGFSIPPGVSPWPSIRPWEKISDDELLAAEKRLDHITEAAQSTLDNMTPVRIRDLFSTHDVLDTFSELDHYGVRKDVCYSGPVLSVPNPRTVSWESDHASKVLAYLRPEVPGFRAIMDALSNINAEVLCVLPGLVPDVARRFATRRLRISLAPVDLPPLLAHTDLAVGYGGSGFVTQALLAGVPLLMRPKHVEQALLARRVEAMGAGKLLDDKFDETAIDVILREMLLNQDYRQAAQEFQDQYRHFSPEHAIELNLVAIEQKLTDRLGSNLNKNIKELQEESPVCHH